MPVTNRISLKRMNVWRRLGIIVLVLALLITLGWGGWWAVSRMQTPESDDEGQPIQVTSEVEVRTLQRTVATRGVLGFLASEPLVAGGSGRVTAVRVSIGSLVREGDPILEIEGRPMVAIEESKPFWRDLAVGAEGPDVEMLQEALTSLGYLSFEPDGLFGSATKTALQAWQTDHGFPDPDGAFRVDDWLVGRWPRRVGRVMIHAGEFVNPGAELFAPSEKDPTVTIELTPSDRLRLNRGDPARIEVAATAVTVDGAVGKLGVTPQTRDDGSIFYTGTVEVEESLEAPEGTQVGVTIIVERAKEVLAVPLASLVSDADGAPVVQVLGANGAVETVPVELGISEGAWVEVVSGLNGDENVLVAQD